MSKANPMTVCSNPMIVCCLAAFAGAFAAGPAVAAPNPLIEKLNDYRRAYGLPALRESEALSRTSAGHATRLMRNDMFVHAQRLNVGRFSRLGEALAMRRSWSTRRAPVIRMWLRSPSHRALVLSRGFRWAGAGRSRGLYNGHLTTIWVLRLGRR